MSAAAITVGIVLAGGRSRRMGGGDKPLLSVGGRVILERIVERLLPQCAALAVNANGDPERFAGFALPVVPDTIEGFAGPLAGILAGMDHAAAHLPDARWIATVAGDTPFLPPDFVARLHAARTQAESVLAVAASAGRDHPVDALWPVSLREALRRAMLDEGMRKVRLFQSRYAVTLAEWPAGPRDPFFNANTPEDLDAAERLVDGLD